MPANLFSCREEKMEEKKFLRWQAGLIRQHVESGRRLDVVIRWIKIFGGQLRRNHAILQAS